VSAFEDDFEHSIALAEINAEKAKLAANDAFMDAMAKAVRAGRERVVFGTHKDTSHFYGARRFWGESVFSACGSPAALCADEHGASEGRRK
jgi:hypothetical protein